jgi:hypothetical protein
MRCQPVMRCDFFAGLKYTPASLNSSAMLPALLATQTEINAMVASMHAVALTK